MVIDCVSASMQWAAVIIHSGFSKVPVQFVLFETLLVFSAVENTTIPDASKMSESSADNDDSETSTIIKIALWLDNLLIAFNMNNLLWCDRWLIKQPTVKYLTWISHRRH